MSFFVYFCIFIVILFTYIHVNYQYKKSEDLEIYEMDYVSNEHLQTICNVKQPVLFQHPLFENIQLPNETRAKENTEINIWNTNDYYKSPGDASVSPVVLSFSAAERLFKTDPQGHYYTEKNRTFFEENGIHVPVAADPVLRPNFTVNSAHDLIKGSAKTCIPLRYHTLDRKFVSVISGKITVKMTPWRSHVFLNPVKDYGTYEFYSRLNPWNCPPEYKNDMDKIRFLEFDVLSGYTLYIPPYWWYSVQLSSTDTVVIGCEYQTAANVLANSPDIIKHYIQIHNTKRVQVRTLENVITI